MRERKRCVVGQSLQKPQAERYAEDVMRVWSAWIDMDKFHPKTYSGESGQGRSFHRLGIAIAGAIIAVGLALIGAAISRLDLFETLGADSLAVVAGFALVLLGAFAIATYGVIRAIEWVSRER
jgi:hypothetical protein